jgi:hypothetical protein
MTTKQKVATYIISPCENQATHKSTNNAGSTDELLREWTYGHMWAAAVLPG